MRHMDVDRFYRQFIGFDRAVRDAATFPPHNIEKLNEDDYRLTLAVAGFLREDIHITLQSGILKITGAKRPTEARNAPQVLHRGIAFRDWEHEFTLGDNVVVTNATLEHGILSVDLHREVPDAKKVRVIPID